MSLFVGDKAEEEQQGALSMTSMAAAVARLSHNELQAVLPSAPAVWSHIAAAFRRAQLDGQQLHRFIDSPKKLSVFLKRQLALDLTLTVAGQLRWKVLAAAAAVMGSGCDEEGGGEPERREDDDDDDDDDDHSGSAAVGSVVTTAAVVDGEVGRGGGGSGGDCASRGDCDISAAVAAEAGVASVGVSRKTNGCFTVRRSIG